MCIRHSKYRTYECNVDRPKLKENYDNIKKKKTRYHLVLFKINRIEFL